MKIIDILNKKANGTLEDGFKFILDNEVYHYNKRDDRLMDKDMTFLGVNKYVDNILNAEVEIVKREGASENKERIEELIENIQTYEAICGNGESYMLYEEVDIVKLCNKINELIRAVNKINGV